MEKLRIIVGGFLGLLPAGGVTWDYLQYPLGFALLGHDVWYVEDTRLYPVYQKGDKHWDDCSETVAHLQSVMKAFKLEDRWAYRDEASGRCFGLSEQKLKEICRTADVLVNVSCSMVLRDEYASIPARALIDSDPMFTQIQLLQRQGFTQGSGSLQALVEGHTHLFTFGESIGTQGCRIPAGGLTWHPTRQPICLNYWKPSPPPATGAFTTLMNWTAGKKLEWEDESWGQKNIEFQKFRNLPKRFTARPLAAVVAQTGGTDKSFFQQEVEADGWHVLDADTEAADWQQYQHFINRSLGEFSVAKETYVKARTGWFSCRSACYLASGRPVVTQDTGWSSHLPTGEGLFAFSTVDEAADSLERITADPVRHGAAARRVAEAEFDSNTVLTGLLNKLNTKT